MIDFDKEQFYLFGLWSGYQTNPDFLYEEGEVIKLFVGFGLFRLFFTHPLGSIVWCYLDGLLI